MPYLLNLTIKENKIMISRYYGVIDFYENPFGEALYFTEDLNDTKEFVKDYIKECDGECYAKIITKEVRV